MRLYNVITKSTLFYTSNTAMLDDEDADGHPVRYQRNYNITIGDDLPCVTKVGSSSKIRTSEI
jgi:hypothetical protein